MVYYQNIRGCRTKLTELRSSITIHPFHIYFLTETWLDPSINTEELGFTSHNTYRFDRSTSTSTKSRGGGVIISVTKTIISTKLNANTKIQNNFTYYSRRTQEKLFLDVYIFHPDQVLKFTKTTLKMQRPSNSNIRKPDCC